MAFSSFFNYLKPGNSSASGNLTKPDKDALHKVRSNPKKPKKVGQSKKKIDLDSSWLIVDADDDDVKVPINRKLQKPKSKSALSSILEEDSDGFYMIDDLVVDTKNDPLLEKLENFEKHTYTILRAKDNSVKVIRSNDPTEWENSDDSDDSFEVVSVDKKVEDKELSSVIANFKYFNTDNAQPPLHLQSFYEPDSSKKPLLFYPDHFDSDLSSSIEVIEDP